MASKAKETDPMTVLTGPHAGHEVKPGDLIWVKVLDNHYPNGDALRMPARVVRLPERRGSMFSVRSEMNGAAFVAGLSQIEFGHPGPGHLPEWEGKAGAVAFALGPFPEIPPGEPNPPRAKRKGRQ